MADYYPLIAKAVAGLEKNTGEARRTLYERARNALVTQLRGITPALSESDITRERLGLEEAIRKVEADVARRARAETHVPHPERPLPERNPAHGGARAEPPPGDPAATKEAPAQEPAASSVAPTRLPEPHTVAPPPPRPDSRPLDPAGSLTKKGLQGFRDVIAEADNLGGATVQASKAAREAFAATAPTKDAPRIEPHVEPEGLRPTRSRFLRSDPAGRGPSVPPEPEARAPHPPRPQQAPTPGQADFTSRREPPAASARARDHAPPPAPAGGRSSGPVQNKDRGHPSVSKGAEAEPRDRDFAPKDAKEGVRPYLDDHDYQQKSAPAFPLPAPPAQQPQGREQAPLRDSRRWVTLALALVMVLAVAGLAYWAWPTLAGLIGGATQVATTPPPASPDPAATTRGKITDRVGSQPLPGTGQDAAPTVAQRVVLYEEDPADPNGKRYVGTAVWRTEAVVPGPGQAADTVVRADIDIPERKTTVRWSLRRNTDKALPASHTIEIMFTLPPDFPHGGISNIPGILMKQAEQTRGVPLAGLAVKVTTGFFLIGLSSAESDMQRNLQLLKERGWFDVPVVYADGRRAILAIEKGTPGDRAFADAFAAWGG